MQYGVPGPDQVDEKLLAERVEAAWNAFVVDADRKYPAAHWTLDRLFWARAALQRTALTEHALGDEAQREGRNADASRHYQMAAQKSADAIELGGVLAARGEAYAEYDAEELRQEMARVIRGAGPWRIMTGGDLDTGHKLDDELLHEACNRDFQVFWEKVHAYAAPHRIAEPPRSPERNGPDFDF